jgi:hypothetical protein
MSIEKLDNLSIRSTFGKLYLDRWPQTPKPLRLGPWLQVSQFFLQLHDRSPFSIRKAPFVRPG